ncbi:MAG: hypothetical protein K2W92_09235 [Alphaproteobacteria bacterium]|nr:hypothetical protein [Alphaproteobacteria bacterium]
MIKIFLTFFGAIFFLFSTCLWAMNSDESDPSQIRPPRNPSVIEHGNLFNAEIPGSVAFKLLEDIVECGYLLTTEGKFVPEDLSSVTNYFRILKVFSPQLGEGIDRIGFIASCSEFTLKKHGNSLDVYKYLFFTLRTSEKSVKNSNFLNENPQCPPFLGRQYGFGLIQE